MIKNNIILKNYLTGALLFKSTSYSYRPWESYTICSINFMSIYLNDIFIHKLPSLSKVRIFNLKNNWINNDLRFTFESFNDLKSLKDSNSFSSCLIKHLKSYSLNKKDLLSLLHLFNKDILLNTHKLTYNINLKLNDSISLETIINYKQLQLNYNCFNLGFFNIKKNINEKFNYGIFDCYSKIFNNINIENKNNIIFIFYINIRLFLPELYIYLIKNNIRIFSFFSNFISNYDLILYHKISFTKIFNITNNNSIFLDTLKGNNNLLSKLINIDYNISIITNSYNSNYYNILKIYYKYNIKIYYIYNTLKNLNFNLINIPFYNNFYSTNFIINTNVYDFIIYNNIDVNIKKISNINLISINFLSNIQSYFMNLDNKNIFMFIKILPFYNTNNWYISALSKLKFFKGLSLNNNYNDYNYNNINYLILNFYNNTKINLYLTNLKLKTIYSNYYKSISNNYIYNYIYNYKLLLLNNIYFINFKLFLGLNNNINYNYNNEYYYNYNKLKKKFLLNNNINSLLINKLQTTLINFSEYNLNSINIKQKNSVILNLLDKFKKSNKINFQYN